MIRRPTIILLVILAALLGLVWYLNRPKPAQQATPTAPVASQTLFATSDGLVNSIKIMSRDGSSVALERGKDGKWVITDPKQGEADQGLAESSATQVTTLRVVNPLEDSSLSPETIGLKDPNYTFTFQFSSGKQYNLTVGDQSPIGSGYYAQLGNNSPVIVDKNGIQSLLMLLTTPPYALTATPTETPTLEPTSTPDVISTPETVTPTP